jgi:hypothetical protein
MFLKVATKTNWDSGRTYMQLTKVGGVTKNISAPFPPYYFTSDLGVDESLKTDVERKVV